MKRTLILILLCILSAGTVASYACTSLIASGRATASGRPLLWKNRDTDASDNYLARISKPGKIGYVGLFNAGGDSLPSGEAWMGVNDAGFAIMNTVAYNLPANSPEWIDREGAVMAQALESCRSVDDFEALLQALPKPMGVRTNFGVIDAEGNGAYFETDDYRWTRYDLSDAPDGVLIRTNYSMSGEPDEGMGYIRYDNVVEVLAEPIRNHTLTPAHITEDLSHAFYNSMLGRDALEGAGRYIIDQDYVPRHSTTASIVIEGILPGEDPSSAIRIYTILGYPPVSPVILATPRYIPGPLLPASPTDLHAPAAKEALRRMAEVFPVRRGNGQKYIDTEALLPYLEEAREKSLKLYERVAR